MEKLKNIALQFQIEGEIKKIMPIGNGHINDTLLVECENKRYILQRINHLIFTKPNEVMNNIVNVTEYLKKIIKSNGGDTQRETLNVIKTIDDKNLFKNNDGTYWRVYLFLEDTICYENVQSPADFYNCAKAFGNFQYMLNDFPVDILHETIHNYHNTPVRLNQFKAAIEANYENRATKIENEIEFLLARESDASVLTNMVQDGELPLRVTHNDTKLNNIMFDKKTNNALCIIDLDTVMQGLSALDFGDAIRFGANTASEDEKDLSKVLLDVNLFEVFVDGFISGGNGIFTKNEIKMLPMGAKTITYEQALRFLGDYLNGDIYYKTEYPEHNLIRAKTQIKLVEEMEKHWQELEKIVNKYL